MPSFLNLYSANDLKAGSDEALAFVMDHFGYTQIYWYGFVRLALGYFNAIVAGLLFFAERKWGWHYLYNYILAAVISHAVLSAAAFVWKRHVEKNAVYIGKSPAGQTVFITTSSPKLDDEYVITVQGPTGVARKVTTKFSSFFDYNGNVVHSTLRPLVGDLLGDDKKKL